MYIKAGVCTVGRLVLTTIKQKVSNSIERMLKAIRGNIKLIYLQTSNALSFNSVNTVFP